MTLTSCTVAELANCYAIQYKGRTLTNVDCENIKQAVQATLTGYNVRVFTLDPQAPDPQNPTSWLVTAKSTGSIGSSENIISRPELLGSPGRAIPGCSSKSTAAKRESTTTGIVTYYGTGQVKTMDNCSIQQILKIAVN
jgi:hypothetical protein